MRKLAAFLLLFALPALAQAKQVKIAVLDLAARGVDKSLADSAVTLIASELSKLEVFKVVSREDIRNMLSFEKTREQLGCEADQQCLAEIGGALGVEYVIAGSLSKIGDSTVLALQLTNSRTSSVENRVSEEVPQGKLIEAISRNSKLLVSKILKGREGWLVLQVQEAGAMVKIDGAIKGTTPMPGRLTLSWGPHLLEVEKQGFVAYAEDISIPNKQVLAKNIALVPSTEFIDRYEGSARKMRTAAWVATGFAVAGAATAIVFNQLSSDTETKFAAAKTTYQSTLAQSDYEQMKSLSNKGNNEVLAARIGLAVGVAGLLGATYFWVAGDDPHKYESFREVKVSAAPADGGGAVALSSRF